MKIYRVCGHTFIGDRLNSASVVFDFGMNKGAFATTLARLFDCRLFGAEAHPQLFEGLPRLPKLTARNVAISGGPGEVQLSVYKDYCASMVFRSLENDASMASIPIPTISFSEFTEWAGTSHVTLLKCDIEGAELAMFNAATDGELSSVEQISVEFHDFLDPTQRPLVDAIIARLRGLSFWGLDFSRNRMDMLFVNQRLLRLKKTQQVQLYLTKYSRGIFRILARSLGLKDSGNDGF